MASKRYWIFIEGRPGAAPHELHATLQAYEGLEMGHSFGSWATALAYLRQCMRAGFVVRVYETED